MRMLRLRTAALLLPFLGACAMSSNATNDRFDHGAYLAEPNVTVEIQNESSSDMEVFAMGPSMRYRLGLVTTVGTHAFKIPHQLIRDGRTIRFVAAPIGGGTRFAIATVRVEPGDWVELSIDHPVDRWQARQRERDGY
jgi:hypothetical protein